MKNQDKVFIMGHKNPDMDCFGAALGISRFCELFEKKASIVIDEYNEALQSIYLQARQSENYQLITSEKALSQVDGESLIIVLDTHRPSMTQCPKLLEMTDKIVVIDRWKNSSRILRLRIWSRTHHPHVNWWQKFCSTWQVKKAW